MCKGFAGPKCRSIRALLITIILVFSLSRHAEYLEHETCIDFNSYAVDDYFSLINRHEDVISFTFNCKLT
jgi:hypothetical protein